MKKVALEETEVFKNSDLCIATEYGFHNKDIDIATAEINGRYPEGAYCVNTDVKEMIYVISGGFIKKMKSFHLKKAMLF